MLLRAFALASALLYPAAAWPQAAGAPNNGGGPFVVGFLFFMYFLPAIGAYLARRRQRAAILLLNLFLGWTVLGWIIALVWAAIEDRPEKA